MDGLQSLSVVKPNNWFTILVTVDFFVGLMFITVVVKFIDDLYREYLKNK